MTLVPFEIIGLWRSPVIGIVGLGQIGLSLAIDLISSDLEVFGFDLSSSPRAFASERGVKVVENVVELLQVADVVFYAIPAGRMKDAVRELSSVTFERRVIVADLCSTKLDVERVFTSAALDTSKVSYVGLHPLAGSEKRSYHGATRELFAGRVMVAAVGAATDVESLFFLAHLLIVATKCRIVFANPAAHDRLINFTIQIPHVFAYIASSFAKEVKDQVALEMFTGNSLRDVIRVARSDPAMVASFLYSNREVLLASLKSATVRIESMITVLDSGDERQLVELLDDFAPSTSKIIYESTLRRCPLNRDALRELIDNLMSSPYLVDCIEVNEEGKLELTLVHLGEVEG
jgi:prephenate dehydrogenase